MLKLTPYVNEPLRKLLLFTVWIPTNCSEWKRQIWQYCKITIPMIDQTLMLGVPCFIQGRGGGGWVYPASSNGSTTALFYQAEGTLVLSSRERRTLIFRPMGWWGYSVCLLYAAIQNTEKFEGTTRVLLSVYRMAGTKTLLVCSQISPLSLWRMYRQSGNLYMSIYRFSRIENRTLPDLCVDLTPS